MSDKIATVEATEIKPGSNSAVQLLQQAVQQGADVAVMEKLLALQEKWETMEARKAYDAAMADLRSELPQIKKNKSVDYGNTHYNYETLDSIVEQVAPIMAEHDLSFRWKTGTEDGRITVACVISHRDGHSEETTLSAPADNSGGKNTIQSIGSAVTYLQRYTLKAALGIAAAEDDDGRAATSKPQRKQKKQKQKKQPKASQKQVKMIYALANSRFDPDRELSSGDEISNWIKNKAGIKSMKDMPKDKASKVIEHLKSLPEVE